MSNDPRFRFCPHPKYNHITFAAFSMLDEQLTFRRNSVIVLMHIDKLIRYTRRAGES